MASSKKGFSALQLQRMIGTNYETAWFLFHRLREAADTLRGSGPLGGEGKIIEADGDVSWRQREEQARPQADRQARGCRKAARRHASSSATANRAAFHMASVTAGRA